MKFVNPMPLGAWTDRFEGVLTPVYSGLSRVALTEAEQRYGPFVVGAFVGVFAFVLYLGRKVLARA